MSSLGRWISKIMILSTLGGLNLCYGAVTFENVCTSKEKWTTDISDSKSRAIFEKAPESSEDSYARMQMILNFKAPQKFELDSQQVIYLSHYWIWRSMLQLGLVHLADEGMSQLALNANSPQASVVRMAALSCVYQLHQRYPVMRFSKSLLKVLESTSLASISSPVVRGQVASIAGSILMQDTSRVLDPNFKYLQNLASGYPAIYQLILGLEKAKNNDVVIAMKGIQSFTHSDKIPPSWLKYKDMASLILGQIYSDQGQFQDAVTELNRIPGKSPWFSDAQIVKSWIFVNNSEYSKVLGSAYHFQLADYKNMFAPEPLITASITFTETCYFPEAWQSIVLFKRNYTQIYKWLKSNNLNDLYPVLLAALKSPDKVPSKIIAEWISSPTFSVHQEELNLIIDETTRLNKINATLSHYENSQNKAGYLRLINSFREMTKSMERDLAARESQMIERINKDLKERSEGMLSRLETLQDTVQYVQIEVTNGGGEDILKSSSDNAGDDPANSQKSAGPKTSQKSAHVGNYQWARKRALASNQDNPELWIDELGLFQANIQSKCQN